MKKVFLLLGFFAFLASCGKPDYETAIANWYQTVDGAYIDMKFKMLEVIEIKDITVADSLVILEKRFEKQKAKDIKSLEKSISAQNTKMSFSKLAGVNTQKYEMEIDKLSAKLDSVKSSPFKSVYDNRPKDEALLKVMKCRYSVEMPGLKVVSEETGSFLLTPDQKKCIGSIK